MRWTLFTALLMAMVALLLIDGRLHAEQATPEVQFSERKDLNDGVYRGSATLTIDNATVKLGEKFTVECCFYNSGSGSCSFYNPFFQSEVPLPAQLAIFDSEKKYLANLLASSGRGGPRTSVSPANWISIPRNAFIGTKRTITAGYLPPLGLKKLTAGDYYLQIIYYRAFASTIPPRVDDFHKQFLKDFDRTELFRSNVVKVQFTE